MRHFFTTLLVAASLTGATSALRAEPPATELADANRVAINEFLIGLGNSTDSREQALGMVLPFERSGGPADLAQRYARWQAGEPEVDALRLLASLSCQQPADSALGKLCAEQGLLPRWQAVDPDNALPWVIAAIQAQRAADPSALQTSLSAIARSSRFDSLMRDTQRILRQALAKDPNFANRSAGERALDVFGISMAITVPSYAELTQLCPTAAAEPRQELATACERLGRLISNDDRNELTLAYIGAAIAIAYAKDEASKSALLERKSMLKSLANAFATDPRLTTDAASESPQLADHYLQQVIAEGEIAAQIAWLATK